MFLPVSPCVTVFSAVLCMMLCAFTPPLPQARCVWGALIPCRVSLLSLSAPRGAPSPPLRSAPEGEASALRPPQRAVQSLFRRLLPGVQTLPDLHSQGPAREALREPGQARGGQGGGQGPAFLGFFWATTSTVLFSELTEH